MTEDQFRREYAHHLIKQVNKGQMTRRQLLVRASVFGFSLTAAGSLVAACGGGSTSNSPAASASAGGNPAPKSGGTLRISAPVSITNLDPVTTYDDGGGCQIMQVAEYLTWVEDDMTLRPVLAESWSSDTSAKVWTFKLRQGVTFNDGSPFGAEDVVTTYDRLVDPKSGSSALSVFAGLLSPGGTVKVDDSTVAFHLDRAFADFPYLVSSSVYNTIILPRNYSGNFVKTPVGTGPFMLKEYVPKERATYVRNPNYWQKGFPYLDGLEFKLFSDPSAAALQLQGGAVDMEMATEFQGVKALQADPKLKILEIKTAAPEVLKMRCDEAPFADMKVRQAVAYCLDRPAVIKTLFDGKSTLGNDTVFSTLFPNAPQIPQRVQDYEKAKQLLADAGHADGLSVTLTTHPETIIPQYGNLIAAMCEPAGIKVKIDQVPYSDYYSGKGMDQVWLRVPFAITEWSPRPTAAQLVSAMLRTGGVWNETHFANREHDRLADEYDATVDEAKRLEIATKLATIENDETPMVIAFFASHLRGMVTDLYDVRGGGGMFLDLSKAYLA